MRYVPNILTCIRISASIIMLFLEPLSLPFFVLYMICGATDVLDGFIARKTANISKLGATLDSVADMVLIAVMLYFFIPILSLEVLIVLGILGIAVIRILSWMIGYLKYKTFASLHTYANKATGLILFSFPFIYPLFGINRTEYVILVVAGLSALEEIAINLTSPTLNVNVKGIFFK